LLISALTLAAHSFTAKALYGSGATSAARTLTVTAATAPTLTSVKGSPSGVEIPQGGSTVETAVTLSGVAAKGQKVEIFDGAVSKGQATAHATTGVWTLLISALAVAAHSFTAKALYGSGATSAARTLTVVQNIVPELRLITDSALVEIPDNGQTIHTTIILSGIAGPGTVIDLVNYGAPLPNTNIQVDAKGTWTFQLTGLSVGTTYNLRARRKGGSVSNARNVVVVAAVVATLDNVLDDKGVEVPQNQTTVSTTLKLKGTASPGQKVEIFDGNGASAVSKGVATAHATTSIWEHSITVALGARRLYAKALYAVNPVFSNVRNLTVTAATAPTLTSVKGSPSGVEIPQGGSTVETAVTLSGVAAKGQKVEIFDGAVSKGQATAHATTGVWTLLISALAVAAHSFTAKALYGSGAVSAARTLTVKQIIVEDFETTPLIKLTNVGQTVETGKFTLIARQLPAREHYISYVEIRNVMYADENFKGRQLYTHASHSNLMIKFELVLRNGVASRITFQLAVGNMSTLTPLTAQFLNSSGGVLGSVTHPSGDFNKLYTYDSGNLIGIKSITFSTEGLFIIDNIRITP
jgi:hypothetical protein